MALIMSMKLLKTIDISSLPYSKRVGQGVKERRDSEWQQQVTVVEQRT